MFGPCRNIPELKRNHLKQNCDATMALLNYKLQMISARKNVDQNQCVLTKRYQITTYFEMLLLDILITVLVNDWINSCPSNGPGMRKVHSQYR